MSAVDVPNPPPAAEVEEEAVVAPVEGDEAEPEQSAPSFFAEREQVAALLTQIRECCPIEGRIEQEVGSLFEQFETILTKYQEAPHLIKHHLAELIEPLIHLMVARMPDPATLMAQQQQQQQQQQNGNGDADGAATKTYRLGQDYDEYDPDAPKTGLHHTARALYCVAKVAGHKSCTSHFPHDVKHMEGVFYTLQHWQRDPTLHREWEVRYCLLLWLSNLILVPFALHTIDSKIDGGTVDDDALSLRVLRCAQSFLGDPSKCREGAAFLIARTMTRPDASKLQDVFFEFAKGAIRDTAAKAEVTPADRFLSGGVLLAVATAFKLGKRDELMRQARGLIQLLGPLALRYTDTVVCKTAIKTMQRLGLSLLKQTSAPWKYKKQQNSLEANLSGGAEAAAATASGSNEGATAGSTADGAVNVDELVPDAIEDVVDVLMHALSHSDTIVRWSAAKGIGRICERLSRQDADDVVQAILEWPFEVYENDSGWHGGCLAVAELCRRSCLLPSRFDTVVPIVSKALLYDLSKGSYSVGSHVRDAACYVCWSVARAYDADDLLPYVQQLSQALVVASLFDREVNVRRASAAALQECVGRLGNFPNGISLITSMDFFSLASLRNAYLSVAPQIAQYESYLPAMIDHVSTSKLFHWDRNVRRTAATATGKLLAFRPEGAAPILEVMLKKAFDAYIGVRHGAIFCVAELVTHLEPTLWKPEQVAAIIQVVPTLESRRLFRGRGGEFVRQACCALLEALANRKLALPDKVEVEKVSGDKALAMTHGKIQQFFDETWKQPLEWLQDNCIQAFRAYADAYHVTFTSTFHAKMLQKIIDGTAESKPPNERRGNILAMGSISRCHLDCTHEASSKSYFALFVEVLQRLTKPESDKDAQDAESRRNAVRSLKWLCLTAQTEGKGNSGTMTAELLDEIVATLIAAMGDYAVDKRGDVGSFVRLEAMEALSEVLLRFSSPEHGVIASSTSLTAFVAATIQQAMEKIDRVRGAAGSTLVSFLEGVKALPSADEVRGRISDIASLDEILGMDIVDWSAPSETFPRVVPVLLRSEAYAGPTLEGLVVSVGGLSVHVLKGSWSALQAALDDETVAGGIEAHRRRVGALLVSIMAKHEHSDRMVVPMALTLEKLLTVQRLDAAVHGAVVVFLRSEMRHFSTDIQKLLPMVPLLGSMCRVQSAEVRRDAWHHALMIIASRYPRVRSKTGTELYTALLVVSSAADAQEGGDANLSGAMDKLTTVQWDDPSAPMVRSARDELYPLLGLTKPERDASEAGTEVAKVRTDAGTYKSLVREMGY